MTDESGDRFYTYVTQVPREAKGTINWKNLLGEFTFNMYELVMGDYSYFKGGLSSSLMTFSSQSPLDYIAGETVTTAVTYKFANASSIEFSDSRN